MVKEANSLQNGHTNNLSYHYTSVASASHGIFHIKVYTWTLFRSLRICQRDSSTCCKSSSWHGFTLFSDQFRIDHASPLGVLLGDARKTGGKILMKQLSIPDGSKLLQVLKLMEMLVGVSSKMPVPCAALCILGKAV